MNKQIEILDSTLRDGAQAEGITFTVEDKLNIVRSLDKLGVSYVEAGNPGSNPKDLDFFKRVKEMSLKRAKLVAFGSTRRRDIKAEDDKNVLALLTADTGTVAIFGKSWDMHATEILKTTLDENTNMIFDTLSFFKEKGKTVIFDAEHFFDGYKANPEYAVKTLKTAEKAGADVLCLCDTNGGCFPDEIFEIVTAVKKQVSAKIGIHCHNDVGCAVANSMMAVSAGVTHVQGTYIGFGERCGNANLSSVIPNLQLKLGYECIAPENIKRLTKTATYIADISNIVLNNDMPYVGKSAFAHKGGMHVDGVRKNSSSFEHLNPEVVGNKRNILLSEVSGRTAILSKIQQFDVTLEKDSPQTKELIDKLKDQEFKGYQYEAATASLELLVLKHLKRFEPFFTAENFKTVAASEKAETDEMAAAIVKVSVGGETYITADEGNGPVAALDVALRKAVGNFYPEIAQMRLTDYKVRVLDSKDGAKAKIRVLIESSDGENIWTTVGVSTDIINASFTALVESIEYKLLKSAGKAGYEDLD